MKISHQPEELDFKTDLIFINSAYLEAQNHLKFRQFENDFFLFQCTIENETAISISRSLFGSIVLKPDAIGHDITHFMQKVESELQNDGVRELTIKCPPSIYSDFINHHTLIQNGYNLNYSEINQHIPLTPDWASDIHQMQKRKIKALNAEGFVFKKLLETDLETVHQFITVCRQYQGLEINISLGLLQQLASTTKKYDLFAVEREGKLSAVCICVRVTNDIAYYYLPATSPLFKSHSPMVLLIKGMVDYYQSEGFSMLDLGISSVEGKPQESLRTFKERMGGIETEKPVLSKSL